MNLVTVITICFNNLDDVINTCRSVDMQEQKPFEHLIIDGSTTTAIKDYLTNTRQPFYRRWICEREKSGICPVRKRSSRSPTASASAVKLRRVIKSAKRATGAGGARA